MDAEPLAARAAAAVEADQHVAHALALAYGELSTVQVAAVAKALGKDAPENLPAELERLRDSGMVEKATLRDGTAIWRLARSHETSFYESALTTYARAVLFRALAATARIRPDAVSENTVAVVRLAAFSSDAKEAFVDTRQAARGSWQEIWRRAVNSIVSPASYARLGTWARVTTLAIDLLDGNRSGVGTGLPVLSLALPLVSECRAADSEGAQLVEQLAIRLGFAQRWEEAHDLMRNHMRAASVGRLNAVLRGLENFSAGKWMAACTSFDRALESGALDPSHWSPLTFAPFAQALIALGTPSSLARARSVSARQVGGEAGRVLELVARIKQGQAQNFWPKHEPASGEATDIMSGYWDMLARAATIQPDCRKQPERYELERAAQLDKHLGQMDLTLLRNQLAMAVELRTTGHCSKHFFAAPEPTMWETRLEDLLSISQELAAEQQIKTRIWWQIKAGPDGLLLSVDPHAQKMGLRGWGALKPVTLGEMYNSSGASDRDRSIYQDCQSRARNGATSGLALKANVAAIADALIGHPFVCLAEAPGVPVEIRPAEPEVEVAKGARGWRIALTPALPAVQPTPRALLLKDEPGTVRLVRFGPEHLRIAAVLKAGLSLPPEARQQVLQLVDGLSQISSVQHDFDEQIQPGDPSVRVQLRTSGAGVVHVVLAVAPFGPAGPRHPPGTGRVFVSAQLVGERQTVRRDLEVETEHLERLIAACPSLTQETRTTFASWTVTEPVQALSLLEELQATGAHIDWSGRQLKVKNVGLSSLRVRIRSAAEWVTVSGELALNENEVVSLQELVQAAGSKSRFFQIAEDRFLSLTEELRERVAALQAVGENGAQGSLKVPALAAPWLADVFDGSDFQTDQEFRASLEAMSAAQSFAAQVPAEFNGTLRPYQVEAFTFLMRLGEARLGAVLADDMGLGKTPTTLAVLLARAHLGPALVIAPTSLSGNWQAEAARFAPTLRIRALATADDREALIHEAGPGDVILSPYGIAQRTNSALAARNWASIVYDEGTWLKNAAAKRTQAAFELRADFRVVLTGTPIENRLGELWALMRLCVPGLLGPLAKFQARFATPIERNRDEGANRVLKHLIRPFIIRRTKAQVLAELPPRTEKVLRIELSDKERAFYEATRRHVLERAQDAMLQGASRLSILAGLTKLRQAACDPRLISPEMPEGAKVTAFMDLVRSLIDNGHRTLVFSQFTSMLALVRQALDGQKLPYLYLDGATPSAQRTALVSEFQSGTAPLFLSSLKAGGVGLTLTAADFVVILDPWWAAAAEVQAADRAHRIGQTKAVTVYRLIAAGTIEEQVMALQADKLRLAESVLDDGAAGAPVKVLSPAELIELMRA
jgi:superfamily II DNA or RNA helicase